MTASSMDDVNNMKSTGLFLQGSNYFDVELLCESNFADGFYTTVDFYSNAVVNNIYSISPKTSQEQKNILVATAECLALDSRASTNTLGLNTQVKPINKLKVVLSEDYVDQL